MTQSIYIHYGKKPNGELVISCYHNKIQSYTKAVTLTRDRKVKENSLSVDLLEPYDHGTVKKEVLKLLEQILIKKENECSKVTFAADLNLCCKKKEELAPFLFDRTLNDFFSGKKVHLILESSEPEFVLGAIEKTKKIALSGVTLKTKDSVKENAVCKVYEDSTEVNLSVPKPSSTGLASPKVAIRDPKELTQAMGKIGLFTGVEPESEDQKTDTKSPNISQSRTSF
ncbi:hypothetical protein [Legionella micdadei]|uniref:hypothetical protein n=1 Tax=Legionella micdadei TaxID=451 RepID=UPI0009EF6FD7|nr:hypothetical protein [Legionella micdadei]ARH00521.1 hypothetical protein B6V88_08835 [Legionella micdadei]